MAKKQGSAKKRPQNRYVAIIEEVFRRHHSGKAQSFEFERKEFEEIAQKMGIVLPKNLGDLTYTFKYRTDLPAAIVGTAPVGKEWIIVGAGRSRYRFELVSPLSLSPRDDRIAIKVPDATPEIIAAHALGDEQALLARVRYNRLVDVFLGITASSLQNHLRTTVKGIGQIEIDELYVGLDRAGCQYVVPVQAKGGKDRHGRQQTVQDAACCRDKFPDLVCRPVSAQFMAGDRIAMFELAVIDSEVKVVAEEHYQLVPARDISAADLALYAKRKK